MIGAAALCQIMAIILFAMWALENAPTTPESVKAAEVKAGQIYEVFISGHHGAPSFLGYRKVLETKEGYVKYLRSDTPEFTAPTISYVDSIEAFLTHARLLEPEANPFAQEETKQ